MENVTPGMRQYLAFKAKYPDCLVLFRMGDFYETFYEDARTASSVLDITLTSRGKGERRAPLAGIPYHALSQYLPKLVRSGYKVALVEQVEDPKLAKGLVKRDLVRIVTPGTLVEQEFLEGSQNNYLLSIALEDEYALAAVDISTGECIATSTEDEERLLTEIRKLSPSEIIFPSTLAGHALISALKDRFLSSQEPYPFTGTYGEERMRKQFPSVPAALSKHPAAVSAMGGLLHYLQETQRRSLSYLSVPRWYLLQDAMLIDESTMRNLELLSSVLSQNKEYSLYGVLDKTLTPMGSRMLKKWIAKPLLSKDAINHRLNTVEVLVEDLMRRAEIREALRSMRDIERLLAKVNYGNASPKDLRALASSLLAVPELLSRCESVDAGHTHLEEIASTPYPRELAARLDAALKDEPNTLLHEGNIIREGYSEELDSLRGLKADSKRFLLRLEEKEREATGIKGLKVGYNRVFGYYLEVSRRNADLVPEHYHRKQTQANSERFVTEELKKLEEDILHAEERIAALEDGLFADLVGMVRKDTSTLQLLAERIAMLDVLSSLAEVSHQRRYSKPAIDEGSEIIIKDGRHPVVELHTDSFVANDTKLSAEERMMIITGPNMAGKSTYMRQVALITVMAHMGCYVPAGFAKIGIVDRIFSRVGAYDDLAHGQSTFMVEMTELANILSQATDRSLVILDEIGRGTSTFDGISIAWSSAEYLLSTVKAKTLFATHYHVLNHLERTNQAAKNFNIAVKEENGTIVFLRKIVHGGTDKSYGVHVASLAGVPKEVIRRAEEIQFKLESEDDLKERIVLEKTTVRKDKDETVVKLAKKEQKGLSDFFG